MEHISQTLDKRFSAAAQQAKQSTNPDASIEETVGNTTTSSIELPAAIDHLIDNKMYRNKFKSLIRRGHLQDLLELAEMAHRLATQQPPSHWFAKYTRTTPEKGKENQPTNWQRTLKMLAKARETARNVAEITKRVKVPAQKLGVVYKACYALTGLAVRNAVVAADVVAEKGGDAFKLFTWLCWKNPMHQTVTIT